MKWARLTSDQQISKSLCALSIPSLWRYNVQQLGNNILLAQFYAKR